MASHIRDRRALCEIRRSDSMTGFSPHQTASTAPGSAYLRSLPPYRKVGEGEWSYVLQNMVTLVGIKWAREEKKPERAKRNKGRV